MTQLDRIEQKLDRLLFIFGGNEIRHLDAAAAVYASGGSKDLKQFMAAEAERKSQGGKQ